MHLCYRVVDPLTDEWVSVLVYGEVIFASCEEGVGGVEVSYIEDCVDCYGEEVGESEEESALCIEGRGV